MKLNKNTILKNCRSMDRGALAVIDLDQFIDLIK